MLARDDAATTRISRRAHDRFRWMEELLGDAKLPDGAKCVGLRLALHMNLGSGLCNPGIASLAEGTARTKRGVQKSIARLEQAGRVRCIQGGRGPKHTNRYELLRTNDGSPIFQESEPKSEQEGEPDRLGERTDVQSNSPNNSNTQTAAAADRSARDANLAIVAESLVRQIIAFGGSASKPITPSLAEPACSRHGLALPLSRRRNHDGCQNRNGAPSPAGRASAAGIGSVFPEADRRGI